MDARKYSEQAMYTNPKFKDMVDKGAKVWEACTVLSIREMAPMFYWFLAGGSYYMQCLKGTKLLKISAQCVIRSGFF